MKKEHISYYISFATIIVSFISLGISCYRKETNLELDYLGIIIGILAVLVTVLIGLQLYNYIYGRNHIQHIIDESVQRMVSDINHVSISRDYVTGSFVFIVDVIGCSKIADGIMKALDEISKCENPNLKTHGLDFIMDESHKLVTDYSKEGKYIYKGKRPEYLHILKHIDHKYIPELVEYVKIAAEMEES